MCFLHMCTSEESGIANEAILLTGLEHLVRHRSCEKAMDWWQTALWKCCCFVWKPLRKCLAIMNWPVWRRRLRSRSRRRKTFLPSDDFLVHYFTMFLYAPRSLVGHETLKDEWYIVIKGSKFLRVWEFFVLSCIPYPCYPYICIESTDSMLTILSYLHAYTLWMSCGFEHLVC